MTDLRQAAQQALEALETLSKLGNGNSDGNSIGNTIAQEAREHLFTALAQPEQEPTPWREMVVATLVREGINKHKARELADHFAAQRPWQGLTDDDWDKVGDMPDTFDQGVAWAAARLKERNT